MSRWLSTMGLAIGLGSAWVRAQTADEIAQETQRRAQSQSQRYEGTLKVATPGKSITDKRWQYDRIGSAGQSKAVLRFTGPPEVKGVALLIVNHPDRASDQWMWTPAVERERRIAIQDRSQRFFGTDFSFEDLEERDVNQYEYKLQGEEKCGEDTCWKLESTPKKTRSSQYTNSLLWVRKSNYTYFKIENYKKERLIRQVVYTDMERVQGIWTARKIEVLDAMRSSRTLLTLERLEYNLSLKEDAFTIEALRRAS